MVQFQEIESLDFEMFKKYLLDDLKFQEVQNDEELLHIFQGLCLTSADSLRKEDLQSALSAFFPYFIYQNFQNARVIEI